MSHPRCKQPPLLATKPLAKLVLLITGFILPRKVPGAKPLAYALGFLAKLGVAYLSSQDSGIRGDFVKHEARSDNGKWQNAG